MDHFYEQIVVKKSKTMQDVLYACATVIMVISGIFGLFTLQSLFYNFHLLVFINGLLFAGLAVLLFLKKAEIRTEFEYTFTNGELDFAKVFNNEKRKNLGSMKVSKVDSFGKVNSSAFQRYINTPDLKKRNWFLNRDAELYYFYFVKENIKNIIIFEPDSEMVSNIKKYLPRGIVNE